MMYVRSIAIESTDDDGILFLLAMKATLDPVKDDEVVVKAEVAVATRPATRIEIIFMGGDGVVVE